MIALLSECESPSQEKTLLNSAFFFAVGAGKLDLKNMGERGEWSPSEIFLKGDDDD